MSKRILSMLLAIVMVVGMMHGMSITANAATSGNCGTNATYTLDDNGLLVISCTNPSETGAIRADAFEGNTNIREIVIEEGITQISNDAFYKCNNLEKVTIKGNLTSLGYRAFGVSSQSSSRNKLVTVEYYGTNPVYTFGQYSDPFANRNAVTVSVLTTYSGQWFANKRITEANKTLMVTKKLSADNVTLTPASGVYNGSEQKPTVVVKDGSKTLVAGTDYTITWAEGFKDAGDYAVTVKGKGNYEDEVTKTYTISPKKLTADNVTLTPASGDYNGTEQKPTVVVKDGSKTLVAGTDYTITWAEGFKDAGDYAVTVKGKGNYDVETSVVKYYKINQVTASVTITPKTLEYTGAAQELITVENVAGGEISYKLGDGEWSTAIPKATNAGTYDIYYKIAGDNNHTEFVAQDPIEVTIAPKALPEADVTISAGVTYNGSEQKPAVVVNDGAKPLTEGTDYTVSYKRNGVETTDFTNAGTITVIVAGKGNYTGSVPKTYTIGKASSSITTAPTAVELTYNGASQPLLATEGTAEGGKVMYSLNAEGPWADTIPYKTDAATYYVWYMVDGDDNHNDVAAQSLEVRIKEAQVNLGISTSATSALPGNKIAVAVTYDNNLAGNSIALVANEEEFAVDTDSKKVEEGKVTFIITLNKDLVVGENEVEVEAIVANDNFQVVAPAIAKVKIGVTDNSDKIAKLEQDIANLEAKLNNKETALQTEINALKAEISSLKATDVNLDAKIEAINKTIADLAGIYATKQELNDAKTELNTAIAQKADTETLNTKVAELITAIANAEKAAKDYADGKDATLKADLEAKITTAKNEAIAAADAALEEAKTALNAAIDTKADKATVDAAIKNLQDAIEALEAVKDNYVAADAELKAELEAAIKAANDRITALDNKIGNVQTDLDATKRKLDEEITKLTNAIAAGDQELSAKINNLTLALEAAKQSLEAADEELKVKIENAQKALQMAIDAVQENLNEAKENLAKAIAAGDKELDGKISNLNKALKEMDAAYKAADENLKKQLETEIKAANDLIDSLEFRMDTAEDAIAVLDKAVEELKAADVANTEAMKAAIENLNKAIKGVKEFAEKSDAETKAALNEKINAAQTALEAKIAEIQANLDKAVEELKAADQANAEKLADAIARLKEAIEVAEAASAAADAVQDEHIIALKNEINRVAIDLEKAQANLEAALKAEIEALTSELKRAEEALKNAIDTKADEDAVNAAIAKLQNEIAALEAAKNNYIAADAALKAEVEAAIAKAKQEAIEAAKGHIPYIGENGNWWIGNSDTGVDANGIQGETGKDGITPKLRVGSGNIWEVSYDNGKTWTSLGVSAVGASGSNGRNGRDGKDGVDGKDGITPQLRINEDTNMWEISYDEGKTWESLGVVATGADGADGANGADGITPQLRINEKTNMWEVSYDEGATWTSMGVKATGADGSSNVLPLVISGISLAGMIAMICIMLVDRKKRGLPVG